MKSTIMKEVNGRLRGTMRKTSFLMFIISLFILAGCGPFYQEVPSEKVASYQANYEVIGGEKDEMLENVSETIYEIGDRSNTVAEEIMIDVIDKFEEFTVPSGRYEIRGDITGNVSIHDEHGDLLFHDILGSAYGVLSITVDLTDTHTIRVDGLDYVSVIPVTTQMTTDLSAGIWEVGTDIEPGDYTITGTDGGFGYLQIFNPHAEPSVYEVIGESTVSDVQLSEGQIIRVTGISMINFQRE